MNFNNSIILTFGKSRKGKFVIDRDMILSIFTNIEKNYSSNGEEQEQTLIRLSVETAELLGIETKYGNRYEKFVDLVVEEDLKVVLGLVRGDKSAEVLFGQK